MPRGRTLFLLALAGWLVATSALPQPPELIGTYPIDPDYREPTMRAIAPAPDGRIVAVGQTQFPWDNHTLLIMLSPEGETIWSTWEDGSLNYFEAACVSGDRIWVRTGTGVDVYSLDGARISHFEPGPVNNSVRPDGAGGIIVCGRDFHTGYVQRYGASGQFLWRLDLPEDGSGVRDPLVARPLPGGGVAVAGHTARGGMLLRIAGNGSLRDKHERIFEDRMMAFEDVVPGPDGQMTVLGNHRGQSVVSTGYVAQFEADGSIRWERSLQFGEDTRFHEFAASQDGFLVRGNLLPYHAGSWRGMLAYLTGEGELYWTVDEEDSRTLSLAMHSDASFHLLNQTVPNTLAHYSAGIMIRIELLPVGEPVVIPPGGGTVEFDATVTNPSNQLFGGMGWLTVRIPGSGETGPLHSRPVQLDPGQTVTVTLQQPMPPGAPAGEYQFTGHIGVGAGDAFTGDGFNAVKEAGR